MMLSLLIERSLLERYLVGPVPTYFDERFRLVVRPDRTVRVIIAEEVPETQPDSMNVERLRELPSGSYTIRQIQDILGGERIIANLRSAFPHLQPQDILTIHPDRSVEIRKPKAIESLRNLPNGSYTVFDLSRIIQPPRGGASWNTIRRILGEAFPGISLPEMRMDSQERLLIQSGQIPRVIMARELSFEQARMMIEGN